MYISTTDVDAWYFYTRIHVVLKLFLSGVMVSMLTLSAVYQGFVPQLGQTNNFKIDICYFSAKHAAFRSKSNDYLAHSRDDVSEQSNIRTDEQNHLIQKNVLSPIYNWQTAHFALLSKHHLQSNLC